MESMKAVAKDIRDVSETAIARQKELKNSTAKQLLVAAHAELTQQSKMLITSTKVRKAFHTSCTQVHIVHVHVYWWVYMQIESKIKKQQMYMHVQYIALVIFALHSKHLLHPSPFPKRTHATCVYENYWGFNISHFTECCLKVKIHGF